MLGQHLATAAAVDAAERATTWLTSALRFLGCTGHAYETAVVFGDEIAALAQAFPSDIAKLQVFEGNVLGLRISGHPVGSHPVASILALVAGADLFGLWGAITAGPLAGLAFVILSAVVKQPRGQPVEGLIEPRKHWPPVRWPKSIRRGGAPVEEAHPRTFAAS